MRRLKGMRSYLCGAMDRTLDGGVEWRQRLTPTLNNMGVVVMNPCAKPYHGAVENHQERQARQEAKARGDLETVAKHMKPIRSMDLRMVDVSDFLIVSIDISVHACGTYEEITLANRQKKPVLCWVQQGRNETPDWLIGMLPTEYFFSSLDDIMNYLSIIDTAKEEDVKLAKRWYTPKYHMLYDQTILNPQGV